MAEGSVTFSTALDNTQLEKDLDGLKLKIEKAGKGAVSPKPITFNVDVSEAEKNLRAAMEHWEDARREVTALEKQMASFSDDKASEEFQGLIALLEQKKKVAIAAEKAYHDAFDKANGRGKYNPANGSVFDSGNTQKKIDNILTESSELNRMWTQIHKELEQAEHSVQDLEENGLWFGDKEFDDAYQRLLIIKEEIKKYKTELARGLPSANPFGLDTLAGKIREAELLLKQLSEQGKGLGNAEYNAAYRSLALLKAEAKEVQKELSKTPEQLEREEAAAGILAKNAAYLKELGENARVADQHIVELNQELEALKARQTELNHAGLGLGYQEYDRNTARIAEITRELKEYQKALNNSSGTELSDLHLQKLEQSAQKANDRISGLLETYNTLREAENQAAPEARADIAAQAEAVHRQGEKAAKYLNELAEKDILGKLSNGAEIAENRINDLSEALDELYRRRENAGNSEAEQTRLEKIIAANERLLDVYNRNLEAAQNNTGLENLVDSAEIADQHIVDLNQELLELKERQAELEQSGIGLGYQEYDQNTARIAEITRELKEYQKALSETGNVAESQVSRTAPAMEKFNSIISKLSPEFGGKTSEITGKLLPLLETAAPQLAEKIAPALERITAAVGALASKLAIILAVVKLVWNAAKKMLGELRDTLQGMASALGKVGSVLGDWLSKGMDTAKKFGSTAAVISSKITKNVSLLMKRINVFSKLFDALGGTIKRMGNMIKRVFVFSLITSGLRSVRTQMAAYLNLNEQFTTALRRLQGVLLTAFQPIYDVVVPALTTFIRILTRAIAAITQFFASLFGTTGKKAQSSAKALYEEANALKAAGSAAEDAAGSLAGFDKINTIQTENKSGGSGGADADTGPLFDWEYDDTPFDSWGEAFSAFLDKLLAGIPKLEEAFKNFADWLNDLAKKLYDMFKYPGVYEKVKQLGRDLAGAFNKLVDWIDWEMLGRALGAGLNLALNFLTSFLYAFDWMNLGRKLAEFVNGLVAEIEWYEFGRLLWAGFKIALETLAGFIMGLNMPLMAEAASNTILGFFDEMYNTIQRIPWHGIGTQIAKFLNNIKWYEVISSVLTAISAAIEAVFKLIKGFINELDWNGIAKQIHTAINDALNLVDWDGAGRTLGRAFVHIFDFVCDVVRGIDWHEIGRNIADFILGFDFVSALSSLAQMIAAGINAAVRLVCGFLDSIEPEARRIAEGIAEGLRAAINHVDWGALGTVIGRGIKTALSFVSGLLDPLLFYDIGKKIGNFLIGLDWVGIIGGLTDVLARAISAAVSAVKGFLDSVQPHLKEIAVGIAEKINKFIKDVDWKEVGRTISRGIEAALDFLIDLLENINWAAVGQAVGDLLSEIDWDGILGRVGRLMADKFAAKLLAALSAAPDILKAGMEIVAGLLKGIAGAMVGITSVLYNSLIKPIIDNVKSLFGIHSPSTVFAEIGGNLIAGLLQGLTQKWADIVKFFGEKIENIKKTLSDAWENIKTTATEKWENIKTTLREKWEKICDTAREKFSKVKDKVSEAWENIKKEIPRKWDEIKTTLKGKWDGIVSSARTWGDDLCSNLASGIKGAIGKVTSAAKSVADKIASYLHFSEPDIGSLSNFHTFMPDMLELMARGIEDNTHLAVNAASDLADSIANAVSGKRVGVNMSMPDISKFSLPLIAQGAALPSNREFMTVVQSDGGGAALERIEKMMGTMLARMGKGNEIVIHNNFDVDGKRLAANTVHHINDMTRAAGKSVLLF